MVFDIIDRDNIDTFIRLARSMIRLQVVMLCEGSDDIDTINALIRKVNMQIPKTVGISDCGGVSKLQEFAPIVSMICKLSKRTNKIVIILDANTSSPSKRVAALKQSLESHNINLEDFRQVSDSIYAGNFERFGFLIKAVGNMELPFKSHEMEDYSVHLLIHKGDIDVQQLGGFCKASDFIEEYHKKASQIIEESEETDVTEAYENIISLFKQTLS